MKKYQCNKTKQCKNTAECEHRKKHHVLYGICNLEKRGCWYAGDLGGLVICKKVWNLIDWIKNENHQIQN